MLLVTSCFTTAKFHVSQITPAADVVARMKQDKNKNYQIVITAKNLASVERLSPAKKTYVAWIVTDNNGIKNIGQLKIKNAKTSTLNTLTAFKPIEIFITAENEGSVSFPSGIEITRAKINR